MCSLSFFQINPTIDQTVRWPICDCYTDVIRNNYSPNELNVLSDNESKIMSQKLIKECFIRKPTKITFFNAKQTRRS